MYLGCRGALSDVRSPTHRRSSLGAVDPAFEVAEIAFEPFDVRLEFLTASPGAPTATPT
jgi:hypothetical protein